MKLTQECYDVLQHCSKFNDHLVVERGDQIASLNKDRNRLMVATIQTSMEPFALHDLKNFLKQLSLFNEPDLTFTDTDIIIQDNEARSTYRQSNKEDLCYLDKTLRPLDTEHRFNLPRTALDKIIRASAANQTEDILLCSRDNKLYIEALNKDKPTRVFSVSLHQQSDHDFEIYLKHSRKNKLNLLLLDYDVIVSKSGIVIFKSVPKDEEINVTFYVASER